MQHNSSDKGILTDLDGALYIQPTLRRRIAIQVLRTYSLRPRRGWRTLRILRAYPGVLPFQTEGAR